MSEITINNIKQFLQGNGRMFADKLANKFKVPFLKAKPFVQEQIYYRSSLCQDCLAIGHCKFCSCDVPGKWFANKACKGKRWPDLMFNEEQWNNFKKTNNIQINLDVHNNK